MTPKEAKRILQKYLDEKDTAFEDDNGKLVTGWKYIIGERVTEMLAEDAPIPLEDGSIGYLAYLVPPEMTIKDICKMDDDEKDEYGGLWCVSAEGQVYTPEA